MAHFEAAQWVPVALPKVFAFFSDPRNLPRIMPPQMAVRTDETLLMPPGAGSGELWEAFDLKRVAGAGSEFVFSFRALPGLPFRLRWRARIEEWVPGSYFCDVQLAGPMQSWHHRHEFRAETRQGVVGTMIGDVVDFSVGWGWPGRLAERCFVLPAMRASFAHRQRQVESALVGVGPAASE